MYVWACWFVIVIALLLMSDGYSGPESVRKRKKRSTEINIFESVKDI